MDSIPSKPKKLIIIICSVAVSFMIGVLVIFLMRMMRNGVRSVTEIERETNVSVLARVPEHPNKLRSKAQIFVQQNPEDTISESIRSILTAIDFSFNVNKELSRMVTISALVLQGGLKSMLMVAQLKMLLLLLANVLWQILLLA